MQGKRFEPLGRHGPGRARKLVEKGGEQFRRQAGDGEGAAKANGRGKAGKR